MNTGPHLKARVFDFKVAWLTQLALLAVSA